MFKIDKEFKYEYNVQKQENKFKKQLKRVWERGVKMRISKRDRKLLNFKTTDLLNYAHELTDKIKINLK